MFIAVNSKFFLNSDKNADKEAEELALSDVCRQNLG